MHTPLIHEVPNIFQDKVLADFRAFCRNEDNRLRDFWEGSKVQLPSIGVRDFEKCIDSMDIPDITDD